MKKNSFLLTLVLSIIFIGCNKNDEGPVTPSTNTLSYYGLLNSVQFDYVMSGTVVSAGGSSKAYFPSQGFYNSPTISEGYMGNLLNAGTVSLNSVSFKNDLTLSPGNCYFYDTTYTLFNSPLVWSVSGGNGIPAFTYTYSATRPTYTGYASLPDTIKLSQNNSFSLSGITGADLIIVMISGSTGTMKVLSGTATSVSFSPSELSSVTASSSGGLFVEVYKTAIANVGGKDFKFRIGHQVYKSIVIQ